MKCTQYQKPKIKKHKRKKVHDFTREVKQKEYEDAKGICRICLTRPITQYHHANEKGMGGGRGLGIQINCIGICDICHNHDNTEFLHEANRILHERISEIFNSDYALYPVISIAHYLKMDESEVTRQISRGFLKYSNISPTWGMASSKDDVRRWLLGVS